MQANVLRLRDHTDRLTFLSPPLENGIRAKPCKSLAPRGVCFFARSFANNGGEPPRANYNTFQCHGRAVKGIIMKFCGSRNICALGVETIDRMICNVVCLSFFFK